MDLIGWLAERQVEHGERDGLFARRLGVTPATWCRLRQRQRAAGLVVVLGALKAWPARRDEIVACALEFPNINGDESNGTELEGVA